MNLAPPKGVSYVSGAADDQSTTDKHLANIIAKRSPARSSHLSSDQRLVALKERLTRNISAILGGRTNPQRDSDDSGGVMPASWSKHITASNIHEGAALYLLRVWPTPEWNAVKDRSAWVFIINPQFVAPHLFEREREHLEQRFFDIVNEWFSTKMTVLEWRNQQGRTVASASGLRHLYEETIVWPVEPRAFAHLAEDFVPRAGAERNGLPAYRDWWEALRHVADTAQNSGTGKGDHPCGQCSEAKRCPQNANDNSIIGALTGVHAWHLRFHQLGCAGSCTTGKESRQDPAQVLLDAGIHGLHEAAKALDGDDTHALHFRQEADRRDCGFGAERARFTFALDEGRQRNFERKLLKFFLARAIYESSKKLGRKWRKHPLQRRLLDYPAALGRLATVLLADQPWTAERIETLIEVLSGYAHQVLGVPERLDLAMHLRQTLRGETALHTLKQRYRDHFFHTVEVCLIGHWLLRSQPARKRSLAEVLVAKCRKAETQAAKKGPRTSAIPWFVPATPDDLLQNWWLAALSHDTAYGIDVLQGTLNLLGYFRNEKGVVEFTKNTQDCVSKLSAHLSELAPELAGDMGICKGDHGLIAAGHLARSLDLIGKVERERFQPAVRAVAFHNTRHPRVDALRDPIAALLILCDTVQDWARSQLGFTRSPAEVLSRIVEGGETPATEQFGPVEAYFFSMSAPKGKSKAGKRQSWEPRTHVWAQPNKLEIRLHYAAWMTEKPDCREKVLYNWADTTFNLQRVDFRGWGLKLHLVHRTPFAQKWKRDDPHFLELERRATELERFAAMVQEQSAAFLKPWLDAAGNGEAASPIGYNLPAPKGEQTECRWEEVTFRLRELGAKFHQGLPLMDGTIGDFDAILQYWSKRATPSPEHRREQLPPR
ncbi:MAG: hypothetical protein NT154_28840 [Verrucomicrobia bacterium]|nr:hypothetical protein [Verrucomicrobiota bacterium]